MIIGIIEMDNTDQIFLSDRILGTNYCLVKSGIREGKVDYLEIDDKGLRVGDLMELSRGFDIVVNETDILLYPKKY